MTVDVLNQGNKLLSGKPMIEGAPSIVPGLNSVQEDWCYLINLLTFYVEDEEYTIRPTLEPLTDDKSVKWIKVNGISNCGDFQIYMPFNFLEDILIRKFHTIDVAKISETDSGIIFEHALSSELERLEAIFNVKLEISEFTSFEGPVDNVHFTTEVEGPDGFYTCGLYLDGPLLKLFSERIKENSSSYEHGLDPKLKVLIGPIVIPSKQAYSSRVGDTLICGVGPNDLIHGYLKRSDGHYWSVFVEDEYVEITSEIKEPFEFKNPKLDRVYLSCELGSMHMNAIERAKFKVGSQLLIDRYLDNKANIIFQNAHFASGHLTVVDDNIGIKIDAIGTSVEE